MILQLDIAKQDLLDAIEQILSVKPVSRPFSDADTYTKMSGYIENNLNENEPLSMSFEGPKGHAVKMLLTGAILQGIEGVMKKEGMV